MEKPPPAAGAVSFPEQFWMNLLLNALKHPTRRSLAVVVAGAFPSGDEAMNFIRDSASRETRPEPLAAFYFSPIPTAP